jgi:hypothetical protein
MKANKRLKRVTALGLSLALSMSLAFTPALAAGETDTAAEGGAPTEGQGAPDGMPEGGMPDGAPGGGGGGGGTAAPSVDYQTLDVLGKYAGVFIRDGKVLTDPDVISGNGTISSTQISGVKITADNIGVWNKSNDTEEGIAGQSGIVILNTSTGDAASDAVTIGGTEEVYDVDGEKYNTVVILKNEDGDEKNTAYTAADWTIDNGDNPNCTYPGAGIAVSAKSLKVQNAFIETYGYHRPALATYDSKLAGDDDAQAPSVIVEDSVLASWGSEGNGSSAPTFTCMYGSARPVIINANADMMFFNSKVLSSDWGSYSLDQCSNINVSIVNSYNENTVGGYGVYAIGSNTVDMYGTTSVSGQYGAILCAAGTAHMYNLQKALSNSDLMANYDGTLTMSDALNEGGTNQMIAVNNAVTFTADMSGANVVSTLTAEDTLFATVDSATADDGNEIRSVLDTYDWLTNFGAISKGAPYFFLNYIDGSTLCYRSVNSVLKLDNCQLESKNGIVIETVLGYDTSASGINVPDKTEYAGYDFTLSNMDVTGDILHEDYQRKMNLTLDNTTLTGTVYTGTMASWNEEMENYVGQMWDVYDEAVGGVVGEVAEANGLSRDKIIAALEKNDSYESFWGANLTLTDSTWNVTSDASLASLTVDQDSTIQGDVGVDITIYVDVDMSNDDLGFDVSTGTKVDTLEAGKTYNNVVIVTEQKDFEDVNEGDWFYDAVYMAASLGITNGTGTDHYVFSPNVSCTRGQIVTMLYRLAGSPTVLSTSTKFTDVATGSYYEKAVAWAVAEGITNGTSATTFSPNAPCTREQVAAFLYRFSGEKTTATSTTFKDVSTGSYAYEAICWAQSTGVAKGMGNGCFSPKTTCTRAQIAQFICNYVTR